MNLLYWGHHVKSAGNRRQLRRPGGRRFWMRRLSPWRVRRSLAIGLSGAIVGFAATLAFAQNAPEVSISQLDTSGLPEVRLVAVVNDQAGQPAQGLAPSDFSGAIGGQPVEVLEAARQVDQERGLGVVLAIDTSGSMAGEPFVQAQQAARVFVGAMLEEDEAVLVSFAGEVREGDFTSDRLKLNRAIDGLTAAGGTLLYDAVTLAMEKAETAETAARAVVLLSDGADNTSLTASRLSTLEEATRLRIPVFAIGIGAEIDEQYLAQVAEASGGRYFAAPTPQQIPEVLQQINDLLRSRYLVRVRLPDGAQLGRELQITVNVGGATVSSEAVLPVAAQPRDVADGDGGRTVLLVVAVGVVVLVLLVGAGYWYWQRRVEPSPVPLDQNDPAIGDVGARSQAKAAQATAASPKARLLVLDGPQRGATLELGDEPVTLGTHADCTLQLRESDGEVTPRHARIWRSAGRYTIHHLAPAGVTRVGGKEVDWAVLEPGDQISIGPHQIAFEVGDEAGA